MKTSYIVIGLVIAVVVIGGVFVLRSKNNSQTLSLGKEENTTPPMEEQPQSSLMVMYGDGGYIPGELKIKKGETVTFKNESSQPMWVASAVHPTHTVYPGSGVQKCGTAEQAGIFDACAGTPTGSNWTFQFNKPGSWGYHNHLRTSHTGKIIVE